MQNGCHSKCIRMNMLNGDGNFSREIVLFFIVPFKALQEKFKKKSHCCLIKFYRGHFSLTNGLLMNFSF